VLDLNDGNQTRAAKALHIGSATLYRKLKEYGLLGAKRGAASGRGKPARGRARRAPRETLRRVRLQERDGALPRELGRVLGVGLRRVSLKKAWSAS